MAVFPTYTRREEIADRAVHLIGLPAGIAGALVLVTLAAFRDEPLRLLSLALYSAGLIGMLSLSAAYNMSRSPRRKEILRRLDHAAIFVMIAGTYTPFMLVRLENGWAAGFCLFVWLTAAAGVALKLLFPRRYERVSLVLYLLLGWSAVVIAEPLLDTLSPDVLALLLAGGLLYSIGVIFHTAHGLRFHNAIWHSMVLAAAVLHYIAVLSAVALPATAGGGH
ncbi:PAQR family membrane homeostasis protein TrhA [Ferruginivarius sediminum]|uniref:Hemolysin III family protein n=1 Tax=Ferruginivarius sediminum TaxID=2661937 RepID=A0A369T4Z1_9PROT|nr:hemolysin III family protein [Ferruginivarius sediminum]RDD60389.1 hemolysin III family protein [Ferruginivarius sediminum]